MIRHILTAVFLLLNMVTNGNNQPVSSIIVAFRNDDISLDSDLLFEYQLLNIFQKYGIVPLYAVIPSINGKEIHVGMAVADSLRIWQKKGWIDIAMHGYTHVKFTGVDSYDQYQMISKGKQFFSNIIGIDVKFFCPPWNAVDRNTLLALNKNNMQGFSGYMGEKQISGITYINCNSNLFNGSLGSFSDILDIALKSESENLLIPLFHSKYDFNEVILMQLDSILKKLSDDNRIRIVSFTELLEDTQYSYILQRANEAGFIVKSLEYNKIFRKIILKTPYIGKYFRKRVTDIQHYYRSGRYKEVSTFYMHLKLSVFISILIITVCIPLVLFFLIKEGTGYLKRRIRI